MKIKIRVFLDAVNNTCKITVTVSVPKSVPSAQSSTEPSKLTVGICRRLRRTNKGPRITIPGCRAS